MLDIDNILPNTKTTEKIKESIKKDASDISNTSNTSDKITLFDFSYECKSYFNHLKKSLELDSKDRIKYANSFDILYWEYLKNINISKLENFKKVFKHLEYHKLILDVFGIKVIDNVLVDNKNNIYYITNSQIIFKEYNNIKNSDRIFNIDKYQFIEQEQGFKLRTKPEKNKCILCPFKEVCDVFDHFK